MRNAQQRIQFGLLACRRQRLEFVCVEVTVAPAVAPFADRARRHVEVDDKLALRTQDRAHRPGVAVRVDQALGRTVDSPLPEERLQDKFEACALRAVSAEASREVYEAIRTLEKITDVRQVTALLEAGVRRRQVEAASVESTA